MEVIKMITTAPDPTWRRPRGRPRSRWEDQVLHVLDSLGLNISRQAPRLVQVVFSITMPGRQKRPNSSGTDTKPMPGPSWRARADAAAKIHNPMYASYAGATSVNQPQTDYQARTDDDANIPDVTNATIPADLERQEPRSLTGSGSGSPQRPGHGPAYSRPFCTQAVPGPQIKDRHRYYLYGALPGPQIKDRHRYYLYGALPGPQMKD
ncbi:hypothetical protein Bbelb_040150 [Branchiostoma belcheri]|nr:hypothetical protein Bbelb_040150 [Branchiostoma belcheri]